MAIFQILLLALLGAIASCQEITATTYPFGDVRNCHSLSAVPPYRMEVLPGIGFDNLRNLDMGQVHAYNFSTCRVSKDGKYLLPDCVFLVPVQESRVDVFAEYFDHWDNHTSMTANSINIGGSLFSIISGKFSYDYSTTKTHMYNDQAKSTRVQIRHKLYSVKLQPGATLHPVFKSRVYDIASSIQNNNTEYAHYLAELMVRDYGTHYITSMDAGAILSQVDFVRSSQGEDMSKYASHVTASAGVNFFSKFSLSTTFQHSQADTDTSGFVNNRTHSQVITAGGPPFTPNLTLAQWEQGVPDALVAIDRAGDPLHFVISPTTLPRLPETTIRSVADVLRGAINRYYKANTRRGCTDPNASNFNFQANLDDHTCKPPSTNFTFGGIFQKCTVDQTSTEDLCNGGPEPALQKNPLTGDLSCPLLYTPVLLHSGIVSHTIQKSQSNRVCSHCHWHGWGRCCHFQSATISILSTAHYEAYWCVALNGVKIPQNDGYLFGGYYNSKLSNPITGAMSCPQYFLPVHMFEDTKVCLSNDYERAFAYAVDFAGFLSCSVGNPLADPTPNDTNKAHWPYGCPHGYAQHLVTVEDGCEINFCVHAGALNSKSLAAPILPPFRKHPKYKANVTETLAVFGVYGEIWARNDDGGWDEIESASKNGQDLLSQIDRIYDPNSESAMSTGALAGVSVASAVVLGLIIVVIIFIGCSVAKKRKKKSGRYVSINASSDRSETMQNPASAESI